MNGIPRNPEFVNTRNDPNNNSNNTNIENNIISNNHTLNLIISNIQHPLLATYIDPTSDELPPAYYTPRLERQNAIVITR